MEINWTNQLTNGLVFYGTPGLHHIVSGGTTPEPVYPTQFTGTGQTVSVARKDTAYGLAYAPATSTSGVYWNNPPWSAGIQYYTMLWFGASAAVATRKLGFGASFRSGNARFTNITFNVNFSSVGAGSTASGKMSFNEYDSAFNAACTSSASQIDGKFHVYVGVRSSGNAYIWKDGVDVTASNDHSTSGTCVPDNTQFGDYTGTLQAADYSLLGVIWNRQLEQGEIEAVSDAPYQLLKQKRMRPFYSFPVSAPSNVFNPLSGLGGTVAQPLVIH